MCQSGSVLDRANRKGRLHADCDNGIDLAKNVFQVHGASERGKAILHKQLRREQVIAFFANLPADNFIKRSSRSWAFDLRPIHNLDGDQRAEAVSKTRDDAWVGFLFPKPIQRVIRRNEGGHEGHRGQQQMFLSAGASSASLHRLRSLPQAAVPSPRTGTQMGYFASRLFRTPSTGRKSSLTRCFKKLPFAKGLVAEIPHVN